MLRELLSQLAPKQRTTVELRVYSDLSFKEVAEVMSCTVGTAKVNFHHAVKNLRKLMTERNDGSERRETAPGPAGDDASEPGASSPGE